MRPVLSAVVALGFGLMFGIGLIVSGMTDPANVKAFLDVAGAWRPALAFVMGAAVLVALPIFQWTRRRGKALTADTLEAPPRTIDAPLLIGAAIFGIGWGLSGICPGPAVVWLGLSPAAIGPFLLAVIVGALLARLFQGDRAPAGRD